MKFDERIMILIRIGSGFRIIKWILGSNKSNKGLIGIIPKVVFLQFLLAASIGFAQGVKVMELPSKYKMPIEYTELTPATEFVEGTTWQVYAIAENTQTYNDHLAKEPFRTVAFLEPFFVTEDSTYCLKLYKDPNLNMDGTLSAEAEFYGWVPKADLLLWNRALVTAKGNIDKKAMILNTVNSIEKAKRGDNNTMVTFCTGPSLKSNSGKTSNLFQVFYVFKLLDNAVLLGKVNRISDKDFVKDDIVGWVSVDKVNFWDHRIAIEPNFEENAVAERKAAGVKSLIFNARGQAQSFSKKQDYDASTILWDADPYDDRNIGDWRRFPLLKRYSDGILRIGVMGEISSKSGEVLTQKQNAGIQREYNEKRNKRRNINIVFVIDGSSSMQPYFGAVSSAVNESMTEITASYTKNNIRFGAVVYRDLAEAERMIEVFPVTNKHNRVSQFLDAIEAKDVNDTDTPEAVNLGLKTALRQTDLQPDETNIIVLIGDAGNHDRDDDSQVPKEQIVSLINSLNANVLAFQVHSGTHSSYNDFIQQAKSIILDAASLNSDKINRVKKNSNVTFDAPTFTAYEGQGVRLDNSEMIGFVAQGKAGVRMKEDQLKAEVKRIVKAVNSQIDDLLLITDQIVMEGSNVGRATEKSVTQEANKYVSSYTPSVLNMLGDMNISDEQLHILCDEKYQFYMEGYSPYQIQGSEYPLYQNVLFLTRLELAQLIIKFDALLNANTGFTRRRKMKDAWVELLKQHIGGLSRNEIEEMTMEQINERVFGLPGSSSMLSDVKLKDITDQAVINDNMFQQYVVQIERKHNLLDKIYNKDNYEYSFSSNDQKYYWIAENLLP